MLRVRRGDRAAFRELYDGTASRILGLIVRLVPEHDTAEDILVDVYAQAWELRERFEFERGSPMAWLLTLARTRSIDRLRSAGRDRLACLGEDWFQAVEAQDETPVRASQRSEERGSVRNALARLDTDRRRLLVRAFFGGLSYSEIAERERLPLGTVKSRIRAGLAQLRSTLAFLDPSGSGPGSFEEAH